MKQNSEKEERVIDHLRSAITDGAAGLADVPALLKRVITEKLWRERFVLQTRETICFATFDDFVRAPPPEGLGASVKTLTKLCSDEPEVIDLIDRATVAAKRGGDRRSEKFKAASVNKSGNKSDNIMFEKKSWGNSQTYALGRLRAARPDLHRKVLQKQLSVHQAMIRAGLRRKTINLPLDARGAATAILKHFSESEIELLIVALRSDFKN